MNIINMINTNIYPVLLKILHLLILFGCTIVVLKAIPLYREYLYNKRYIEEMQLDPFEDVSKLVDDIIISSLTEYLYLNGYMGTDYITQDEETQICKELSKYIITRMSENVISKISLIYNKDSLPDILSDKIYITVTSFITDLNTKKKME